MIEAFVLIWFFAHGASIEPQAFRTKAECEQVIAEDLGNLRHRFGAVPGLASCQRIEIASP